jgi:hypothetical protein
MKYAVLLIITFNFIAIKLNAQTYCELDSSYKNFPKEVAYKVIQSRDGNFICLTFTGVTETEAMQPRPVITLRKINPCGDTIWSKFFDNRSDLAIAALLREEENGDIVIAGEFLKVNNPLWLIKTNKNGDLIWHQKFGNANKTMYYLNCNQINSNRYLFTGSISTKITGKFIGMAIMTDSLGYTIFEDSLTSKEYGTIISSHKVSENLYQFFGLEASTFLLIVVDSVGNVLNKTTTTFLDQDNVYGPNFEFNYKESEILDVHQNGKEDSLFIRRIAKDGTYLKSKIFTGKFLDFRSPNYRYSVVPLPNKSYLISAIGLMLVDSNLTIQFIDTSTKNTRQLTCSIISSDSSIVSVGTSNFTPDGTKSFKSNFYFSKIGLSTFTKSIQIIGGNSIKNYDSTLQLNTLVLPKTSLNKEVIWSVLDTSFASINQNGLLQAKKNGVVEVKALAKDGSGVFATKNINKQRVPLGTESKISEKFEVNIFPNPSNGIFQFEDNKYQAKLIQIWDLKGQLLQSIHSDEYMTEVDLSDLNSGIYLVAIVVGQEKVFRRVVLSR